MALHTSLDKHLEKLKDPRRDLRKRYPLKTLVILTVMAGISGADDWVAVERYCHLKWKWLSTLMDLPLIDFRNKQGSNAEGLGKGCQSIKVHVAQQGTRETLGA